MNDPTDTLPTMKALLDLMLPVPESEGSSPVPILPAEVPGEHIGATGGQLGPQPSPDR